jgi:sugar O-acyltransferase (sialic acid O-acetyltransferase NeuD family)
VSGKSYVVFGGGGHAKVVIATIEAAGDRVIAVLDEDPGKRGRLLLGHRIAGPEIDPIPAGAFAVIALGANATRKAIAERLRMPFGTVVHPGATVHPSVKLGEGTVVMAGVVIQPDTVIGRHSIINTAASVDHDCVVGDFTHIAPGVHLSGGVTIGDGVLMGVGSCAIPGMTVGDWATVGAGGVVVEPVAPNTVAAGSPARPLHRRME